MNIFYLDHNPQRCARMHCDKHVVKMILEYAQLLCTAHHEAGSATEDMYRATHRNHPSAVWARSGRYNYIWLYTLFCELLDEYRHRYGRVHATSRLRESLASIPPNCLFTQPRTEVPQCMPDKFKVDNDPVTAYRNYYVGDKAYMAKWTKRNTPIWFSIGTAAEEHEIYV